MFCEGKLIFTHMKNPWGVINKFKSIILGQSTI